MNTYACNHCQDTGMTRSGFLDCTQCDAAERRAAFNARLEERGLLPSKAFMLDIAWEAYRMGREDKERELPHAR